MKCRCQGDGWTRVCQCDGKGRPDDDERTEGDRFVARGDMRTDGDDKPPELPNLVAKLEREQREMLRAGPAGYRDDHVDRATVQRLANVELRKLRREHSDAELRRMDLAALHDGIPTQEEIYLRLHRHGRGQPKKPKPVGEPRRVVTDNDGWPQDTDHTYRNLHRKPAPGGRQDDDDKGWPDDF